MSGSKLEEQITSSFLSGGNMNYIDALYEDYLVDVNSVPKEWQDLFHTFPRVNGHRDDVSHRDILNALQNPNLRRSRITETSHETDEAQKVALGAIKEAYRKFGHLSAKINPLDVAAPKLDSRLTPENNSGVERSILHALQTAYCGHLGFEFMHIDDPEQTAWWITQVESSHAGKQFDPQKQLAIFEDLVAADGLERYLGTRFVGQKRFSLEGGDALIPMMRSLLDQAGRVGVSEMVIGMAHRGRLNMLVNVLGKSPQSLFDEFEGKAQFTGMGDVKYHMGFSSDLKTRLGDIVHVALAFNPSHLEIIGPVVEGSVRARLRRQNDLAHKNKVLPVLIHGDAAFAGQGVVMEMLNFSQVRGFCTGGTVHLVINNQIGFTTSNPLDARSTRYCTDIAKMINAPVIHVNGDDVEATVHAMELAFAYRQAFKRDVIIDLVCYRRHGHNEADEPAMTQPTMYQRIKTLKPLRDTYGESLVKKGVLSESVFTQAYEVYRAKLDKGECLVDLVTEAYDGKVSNDWTPYIDTKWTEVVDTGVQENELIRMAQSLQNVPQDFTLHPVIARLRSEQEKMITGDLPINWGYAETLAYASLLDAGFGVRLTGQDAGRGTFAHRHAVLHDYQNGQSYIPLTQLVKNQEKGLEIIDSLLSEEAVLAFEYGYACSDPLTLVLWEAQFGDFANGAQVVIDQFISSGEQKWGRLCGLVMLLPHGYEGQGPEHSSARLERYMQLCAQHNIQVCVPTTPAQIFHLLRRQMLRPFRKPLIVMTPKSILRHKLAVSSLSDLTTGCFQPLIPEIDPLVASQVTRLVICSGKVYYDLLQKRREADLKDVAIIRIEQLYPFPEALLVEVLAGYPKISEVVWCQEEPENQGSWFASAHHIRHCIGQDLPLSYAGREFAASPAVGSPALHAKQQEALVGKALGISREGKS